MRSVAVGVILVLLTAIASAQTAEEVSNALAEIAGKDPIKAAMAADEALKSSNTTFRSLALEAALKSADRRVQAIGYNYIVGTQKQFMVDFLIPSNMSINRDKDRTLFEVHNTRTVRISITNYDRDLGQFELSTREWGSGRGAIARDGITMRIQPASETCTLRFAGVEGEYLVGTLRCAANVIPVRSALP